MLVVWPLALGVAPPPSLPLAVPGRLNLPLPAADETRRTLLARARPLTPAAPTAARSNSKAPRLPVASAAVATAGPDSTAVARQRFATRRRRGEGSCAAQWREVRLLLLLVVLAARPAIAAVTVTH